jgi:hypothetical protein
MREGGIIEPFLDDQSIRLCYILTVFFDYLSDYRERITSF